MTKHILIEGDSRFSPGPVLLDPDLLRSASVFKLEKKWRVNFVVGDNHVYVVEFTTKKAAEEILKSVHKRINKQWGITWFTQ